MSRNDEPHGHDHGEAHPPHDEPEGGAHDDHGHGHAHGVVNPALVSSVEGMGAIKASFALLFVTSLIQVVIVVVSGSVALLADTIHNFGDAATAIPLGIAFLIVRRKPTRRFPYGFGRVEDLAGLAVILTISASAVVAGYEAVHRLLHPAPMDHLLIVAVAAIVGFVGNQAAAVVRIRAGRRIGSAALVADGMHARTDSWTSLSVLIGAGGTWLGFPLADPIVGLLITVAIVFIMFRSAREVFVRILDGIEPETITAIEKASRAVPGVLGITQVRARWSGHRQNAEVSITVSPTLTVREAHQIAVEADGRLRKALPFLASVMVHVDPSDAAGEEHHHEPS
jgi:cation diffusion facilitator family transporter